VSADRRDDGDKLKLELQSPLKRELQYAQA